MKVLGHPVHMMLIHFPSALFPMEFACSAVAAYTNSSSFAEASFYAMVFGAGIGLLAIVAGAFDVIVLAEEKPAALRKALIHGAINSTVVLGYTVLALRAYRLYPELVPDGVALLIAKGVLITLMVAGNYFGADLILKHGVGVGSRGTQI